MLMEGSRLASILLYDIGDVRERLFLVLKEDALVLIPSIMLIASFSSFFFGLDFGGVLKRAVLGVATIFIFQWFFTGAATVGFKVGDSLISKDNHILKDFLAATSVRKEGYRAKEETGKIERALNWAAGLGDDFSGFVLWLFSNLAMWFVKLSFSIAYYLPLIVIPVIALVNILPFTSKALDGAYFSAIWIAVTPIIVAVLLEILNSIIIADGGFDNISWLARCLMATLFSFYLVGSFMISHKMLGASGVSEGITGIGQSYGAGMAMMASGFLRSTAKKIGKGSFFKGLRFGNYQRGSFYQKAGRIQDRNALTAGQVGNKEKSKLSVKEKATIGGAMALSPLKAIRDRSDRKKAAKYFISQKSEGKVIDRRAMNTFREAKGKRPISPSGKVIKDQSSSSSPQISKKYLKNEWKNMNSSKVNSTASNKAIVNRPSKKSSKIATAKRIEKEMPRVEREKQKEDSNELREV
jgi:hypothetical protein